MNKWECHNNNWCNLLNTLCSSFILFLLLTLSTLLYYLYTYYYYYYLFSFPGGHELESLQCSSNSSIIWVISSTSSPKTFYLNSYIDPHLDLLTVNLESSTIEGTIIALIVVIVVVVVFVTIVVGILILRKRTANIRIVAKKDENDDSGNNDNEDEDTENNPQAAQQW